MFSKLGIGLLLATAIWGSSAHAAGRFGKRGSAPAPVPSQPVDSGSYHAHRGGHGHSGVQVWVRPAYRPRYYYGTTVVAPAVVAPAVVAYADAPYAPEYQQQQQYQQPQAQAQQPQATTRAEASSPGRVSVGLEGQLFYQGANVGASATIEGAHWGFTAQGYHWALLPLDGAPGVDTMQTASARVSYALLSSERGRFRVEAGGDVARTSDVMMVGPTFGVSALANLWLVSFEASAMWTPLPYTQLDLRAGAGVNLGPVQFRGGYRAQFMSDQGVLDGIEHAELFQGPYAGIALVF